MLETSRERIIEGAIAKYEAQGENAAEASASHSVYLKGKGMVIVRTADGQDLACVVVYTSRVYRLRPVTDIPKLIKNRYEVISTELLADLEAVTSQSVAEDIMYYQRRAQEYAERRQKLMLEAPEKGDEIEWLTLRGDAMRAISLWLSLESKIAKQPAIAALDRDDEERRLG